MKPFYEDKWVKIFLGDCREVIPQLDVKVDLVITSPPFNQGDVHHTNSYRFKPYPDDLPEEVYQSQQIEILDMLWGITKTQGSLFYEHKNRIKDGIQISPYRWIFKTKWIDKQEIVWENRSHNFDPMRFLPMTQRVYWLTKIANTQLENNNLLLEDLWRLQPMGTNKSHARAYPETLPERILVCFPSSNLILDPFLGSGTTCYCAKKLNRYSIGIEIEEKYCEIAAKRCSQEVMDFSLTGEGK